MVRWVFLVQMNFPNSEVHKKSNLELQLQPFPLHEYRPLKNDKNDNALLLTSTILPYTHEF